MSGGGGRGGGGWVVVPQPAESFLATPDVEREDHWTSLDDSVNAVSFGFVATAILISMFLLMAIFEKFLRARSAAQPPPASRTVIDIELGRREYNGKLEHPSPKATVFAREVSVLMPGDEIPTFIANPAPPPCPPERLSWPLHYHHGHCLGSFSAPAQSQGSVGSLPIDCSDNEELGGNTFEALSDSLHHVSATLS